MASYENCPEDVDLVSVATLESIFEMEQLVIRLDANGIPWRVVEHDSKIFKSLSANLGHSTLYVAKGREEEALELLLAHRKQQLEGHECPGCKLWLGPSVDICPACGVSDGTLRAVEGGEEGEEVPGEEEAGGEDDLDEDMDDEDLDGEDEVDVLLESMDRLQDSIEMIQTSIGRMVSRLEALEERIERLEKAASTKDTPGQE